MTDATRPAPEDDAQRIARLEAELKASGRVNYLLQEASARVVWNNDHLRAAMRWAIERLAEAGDDQTRKAVSSRLDAAMAETLSKRMGTDGRHD